MIAAGAVALATLLPRLFFRDSNPPPAIIPRPSPVTTRAMDAADVAAPKRAADGSIDPAFWASHLSHLNVANPGEIRLLFLGDSLTGLFPTVAPDVWSKQIAPRHVGNFAVGGNLTQQVLWQIDNGELDHIHPQAVVLLIGTNNLNDTAENIVRGIARIVSELHTKLPAARVLLLGLLPRDVMPGSDFRIKILAINRQLSQLDNGTTTRYLDIGPALLAPDGKLLLDTTADGLHLSARGYEIWFEQMEPLLNELAPRPGISPSTQR